MSNPYKLFQGVYTEGDSKERKIHLYAKSLADATLSATEMIGPNAELVRIFHDPDW